ncbi:hypothetical protein ABIB40_000030 [Pedobacter sp. UYP30]|uniref:hypothetical protein n=1 Tax=Pedobacter sp. UYP30 TaxID=1756400 RepID=UPI0033914140
MQPVLIYKDELRVTQEKEYLDTVIAYMQTLYNEFKTLSVDVTLTELVSLGRTQGNISQKSSEKRIDDFVMDYLIVKAGEPSFNGVRISREKLGEMIEKPDLTAVFGVLNSSNNWRKYDFAIVEAWLKLDNDIVSKSDNAYDLIDALYTYYSKNDFGAVLTTKLFDLCGIVNTYYAFCTENGFLAESTPSSAGVPILGIEFKNYSHRPNLDFIREKEGMKEAYAAV